MSPKETSDWGFCSPSLNISTITFVLCANSVHLAIKVLALPSVVVKLRTV